MSRRTFVHAPPRAVWSALNEPATAGELFGRLDLGPPDPGWPAAGSRRRARVRLGLLPLDATLESLEARPRGSLRLRLVSPTFKAEQRWTLEAAAGGTRVVAELSVESAPGLVGLLGRIGRSSMEDRVNDHLAALKRRAEGAVAGGLSGRSVDLTKNGPGSASSHRSKDS